ncbi:MAG: transposase [Acidobacteria bacterium]|nr:transposase [Acidobacteriota bacterium]
MTRDLDRLVRNFHRERLQDEWAYLFLDGVSLRIRRSAGRKRVQLLVTYGVRRDGAGNSWPFCAARAKARRPGRDYCRICTTGG